jgi:Xaa-Pro aminopeptidase
MDYSAEMQIKLERARALMDTHGVDVLWLRRVENVNWITGGTNIAVNTASAFGVASVVITATTAAVWTNTIEAPRLSTEDRVQDRGFGLDAVPWEGPAPVPQGKRLGVDYPLPEAVDMTGDLTKLRVRLLPVEQDRFRTLSIRCAEAMQHTVNRIHPGHSEAEIAAALAYEVYSRDVTPVVILIAADERIHRYRHPLPTTKVMNQYAMLVLCGRRDGLVCSLTRLIHFAPLPDDLRRRMDACAEVDAAMIAASLPGATLEDVLHVAQDTYAKVGYDGEWKLHHQGGLTGYTARDVLAVPGEKTVLEPGMVCAWNPSITGTKSEDSILVPEAGGTPEVLTRMYGWPTRAITARGKIIDRPLILETQFMPPQMGR